MTGEPPGQAYTAAPDAARVANGTGVAHEDEVARLAEAQARVVAALVAGAEVPEGFDPGRMRAQAASLIAKRRAIVARIRPDTAVAAGPDLAAEFAAYARARAAPPPGYRADADDFAAWLRERGRMLPTEPSAGRRAKQPAGQRAEDPGESRAERAKQAERAERGERGERSVWRRWWSRIPGLS
ncbi:hypothetical protein ACGFJC_40820 [Nonomuraea fuscirosea]|uniref:hypothetical protein n=1 Tax=Nonomuraea fuscirosea TaxID=1291556 RepID=UPI00372323B7